MSKLVELLDTLIFIARKKADQITFLHVFHHASMFAVWWVGVKWVAGGMCTYAAQMQRQLILSRISKSDATRCQILRLKRTKFFCHRGSARDPS